MNISHSLPQLMRRNPKTFGKFKVTSLSFLAFAAFSSNSLAVDYTWNGSVDGDWTNSGNWDGALIPVDDRAGTDNSAGLSMAHDDLIIFSATTLPSSNIPQTGGLYDNSNSGKWSTPAMQFNSGGAVTLGDVIGQDDAIWTNFSVDRTILTVGDGVDGGTEDVAVTYSANGTYIPLNRHIGGRTHNFVVNSDGTLNFAKQIDFSYNNGITPNPNRWSKITINGGSVIVNGATFDLPNLNNYVDLTEVGGSFKASFGGNFADLAAVEASFGTSNVAGVGFIAGAGVELEAVDNLDGSFTVTAVTPLVNYWTGTGGATWDQSTTVNFTTNAESAPLSEDTFANATAVSLTGTFADEYFNSSTPVTVTENNITIAAGGVSTDEVEFTNNAVSYNVSALDGSGITGGTKVVVKGGGSLTFSSPNTHTGTTSVTGSSSLVLADSLALQNSTLAGNEAPVFDQSVGSNSFTLGGLGGTAALVLENNAVSPAAIELVVGNNDGNTTYTGEMSGAGGLTKIGTGTLTLDDPGTNNSFTGDTFIKEGRIIAGPGNNDIGLSTASAVFLGDTSGSADATLQFDVSSSTVFPASISYTVQAGSTGVARLHNSGNTQVQGDVILGSPNSDGKGVTIEAVGAQGVWDFRFQGVIQDPSGMTAGTAGDVTIGSNNIGEVRFEGAHTYSGNTLVESGGQLFVLSGGTLTFYPTSNGTSNQLRGGTASGTGTVILNSPITLDLTGANTTDGNMWTLVDATDLASVTYSNNFGVTSTSGAFTETAGGSGLWRLDDGTNIWTFTQSTGTLEVQSALYTNWATSYGLAGADADQTADIEGGGTGDGLNNLLEFAHGTNPNVSDNAVLSVVDGSSFTPGTPAVALNFSPLAVTFRYVRRKNHVAAGLTYTPRFIDSTGSYVVDASAPAPTVVSTQDGGYEVVEVPFPLFETTGKKAKAMLAIVDVTLAP